MAVMLDQASTRSLDEVRRVVSEEFGAPPEKIFAIFEPQPIASASLAQVHAAYTKDGHKVQSAFCIRGFR